MKRIAFVGLAIGGLIAGPVMAQPYTQPVVQRDTVPVQISQVQIKDLQRTLNRRGFSAGKVDGLWGPDTAAALKRFQSKNALNPTGELDRTTELKLGMIGPNNRTATPLVAAPVVAAPVIAAPVLTPPVAAAASAATTQATPAVPVLPTTPPASVVLTPVTPTAPPATASTTRQPKPTSGANSFTAGQAHDRIESEGFQNVRDLVLDSSGIWRGMALKNGQAVHVWLDYQGDVGQQ